MRALVILMWPNAPTSWSTGERLETSCCSSTTAARAVFQSPSVLGVGETSGTLPIRVDDVRPWAHLVISVRRPAPERVEEYRRARLHSTPTALPASEPPPGFRHDTFSRAIGSGPADFERARRGLHQWAAHRRSGVEIFPTDAGLAPGSTVAILTRQLGLWVLASCRIETVINESTRFGFVYATLPDHPEQGYESFVVSDTDGEVMFEIEAVSRPGIPLVRFGAPVTRILQSRASDAYLAALHSFVDDRAERP